MTRLQWGCALAICAVGAAAPGWADLGGMYIQSGGSLAVIDEHPAVAMRYETITFRLGWSGGHVEAAMNFENTGGAQDVLMGFPIAGGGGGVSDVEMRVGDAKLPVTKEEPGNVANAHGLNGTWYTTTVHFGAKQKLQVVVSYNQLYTHVEMYGRSLRYWLRTGASWKGDVDYVDVRVEALDPDNWSELRAPLGGQGYRGVAIGRFEHYNGDPPDFIVNARPSPRYFFAFGRGLRGTEQDGGRAVAVVDGKTIARADAVAASLPLLLEKIDGADAYAVKVMPDIKPADVLDPGRIVLLIKSGDETVHPLERALNRYEPTGSQGWHPEGDEARAQLAADLTKVALWEGVRYPMDKARALADAHRDLRPAKSEAWNNALLARLVFDELLPTELRQGTWQPEERGRIAVLPEPRFAEAFPVAEPIEVKGDWIDLADLCRAANWDLHLTRDCWGLSVWIQQMGGKWGWG